MLEGTKITHYTFKETLPLWRKKDQAMVHRQEKKQNSLQKLSPRAQKGEKWFMCPKQTT